MKRRDFSSSLALGTAAVFAAEAGSGGAPAAAAQQSPAMPHIVDTNLSLFHWPFRRLPLDELPPLVQKMRSLGIQQAWAGSFEGLLHRDLSAVNRRLAATCKQFPELLAIGSVNPQLPDWQTDLRQCVEQHRMPGIRLHPNYHGYTLEDPQFERLLQLAGESNCLVQLAVAMEDTRTQHPMLQVPDVDLTPLPRLLQENPRLRLQVLNWRPHPALLAQLASTPGVSFDIARVEGTDQLARMLGSIPVERLLFGSHAPFLIPEAALIRVHEAELDPADLSPLLQGNALRLLAQL